VKLQLKALRYGSQDGDEGEDGTWEAYAFHDG